MNRYTVALVSFFPLRVFRDFTVNVSAKYLYLEVSRRVFGISYIAIGQ
jgi:hypothetical protein